MPCSRCQYGSRSPTVSREKATIIFAVGGGGVVHAVLLDSNPGHSRAAPRTARVSGVGGPCSFVWSRQTRSRGFDYALFRLWSVTHGSALTIISLCGICSLGRAPTSKNTTLSLPLGAIDLFELCAASRAGTHSLPVSYKDDVSIQYIYGTCECHRM